MTVPGWLAVAAGGVFGALARHGLGTWVQTASGARFPLGTLLINLSGSAALGLLFGLGERVSTPVRLGLGVGFLGAFTTFSTFSVDNIRMMQAGEGRLVLLNLAASVGGGLLAAWAGVWVAGAWRG